MLTFLFSHQPAEEHQILFFESHFTELKIGVAPNNTDLSWCVSGTPQWSTSWDANTWYNFAYDIDVSDILKLYLTTDRSSPLLYIAVQLWNSRPMGVH